MRLLNSSDEEEDDDEEEEEDVKENVQVENNDAKNTEPNNQIIKINSIYRINF